MGDLISHANATYRNFALDGVPASGKSDPEKAAVRRLWSMVDLVLSSMTAMGAVAVVKATKAALDADLAHAANTMALVWDDGDDNGIYVKAGASGAGSWAGAGLTMPSSFAADLAVVMAEIGEVAAARDTAVEAGDAATEAAAAVAAAAGLVSAQSAAAVAAASQALAAADSIGPGAMFLSKAEALSALPGLADQTFVEVLIDESRGNERVRYRKESGALAHMLDMPVAVRVSSQPPNAKYEIRIPLTEPFMRDNVATLQNRSFHSVVDPGDGRLFNFGNTALRLCGPDGWEMGAWGFTGPRVGDYADFPTHGSTYFPMQVFMASSDLSGGVTDYGAPDLAWHVDIPPGAMYRGAANPFSGAASFTPIQHFAQTGAMAIKTRNILDAGPGQLDLDANVNVGGFGRSAAMTVYGYSTYARLRERSEDDYFALTTNVDTGVEKQNVAKSSWEIGLGAGTGFDRFVVARMGVGATAFSDQLVIDPSGAYFPGLDFSVGGIGVVKSISLGMNGSRVRMRERDGNDSFAITTNIDTGTTKDDVAMPAWEVRFGGAAPDDFAVRRMAAGSSSWVDLLIAKSDVIGLGVPLGLKSYTVATLPIATAARVIFVSDGASNKRLAVSDGSAWRWPDGAVVS